MDQRKSCFDPEENEEMRQEDTLAIGKGRNLDTLENHRKDFEERKLGTKISGEEN